MIPLERCDCPSCGARRLAWRLFLAGIAVLPLIAVVRHAGEQPQIVIDQPKLDAGALRRPDFMLFAPCPLTRRNLPKHNERIA